MADTRAREEVRVGRQTVPLSNTGKVLFPDGITKGELVGYYQAVAGVMLPYLQGRPLSMARYPDGIGGDRIFQKNAGRHFPDSENRGVRAGWPRLTRSLTDRGVFSQIRRRGRPARCCTRSVGVVTS